MKYLVPVFAILLVPNAIQAQAPAHPEAPKSKWVGGAGSPPAPAAAPARSEAPGGKFVMTAAPRPAPAHASPARHARGHRRSHAFYYQPSSVSLTSDPANSISEDDASSRQSVAPLATDINVDSVVSWEPSTYMDYDAALALGLQMQSAAAQPNVAPVSLGELARSVRAARAQADAAKPLR